MKKTFNVTTEQLIEFNTNSAMLGLNRTLYTGRMLKAGEIIPGKFYDIYSLMYHVNSSGLASQRVLILTEKQLVVFDMTMDDFDRLLENKAA